MRIIKRKLLLIDFIWSFQAWIWCLFSDICSKLDDCSLNYLNVSINQYIISCWADHLFRPLSGNHGRGSVFHALQLSEWTASGRPRLLLFTFPATYSYLLLITLPPSVVTKTQSNPPSSAWHHTDRRTLTHFVGELADSFSFIYFPFFFSFFLPPPRLNQPCCTGHLQAGFLGQKTTVWDE